MYKKTLYAGWADMDFNSHMKKQLEANEYEMLAVVHAETSTGVRNPVADIGKLITALPCLYLVDTVTSLGGIEITQDAWHIDALYSSTQKCLSCPPGLDDLGLEMLVDSFFRLPMLKALRETL